MAVGNPFKQLSNLYQKPALIPGEVSQVGHLTPDDKKLLQRIGLTATQVRRDLQQDTQIFYDRYNLYHHVERALEHSLVGAAMELYANYTSVFSTLHNATVWITSESPTYQRELTKLLERIGIEEKIFDWAFTAGSYGDMFVKINGLPGQGVISVDDSDHPINISRVDHEGILIGYYKSPLGQSGDQQKLISPWEYVHFRLLGGKKQRPRFGDQNYSEFRTVHLLTGLRSKQVTTRYGTSLLLNALPIYRRLRLAEDSLLLARLSRGLIRYIWKLRVDSTNMESVGELIDQYSRVLREARSMNTREGSANFQSKENPMACLRGNTQISLMNGNSPTIEEMAKNPQEYIGKSVLTVNEKTKHLEPHKIKNIKKTRRNALLVRVHLDRGGKYVDCTPDHKFMLRDGTYKEAQDLKPKDSLMPYYHCLSEKGLNGYKLVYDPGTSKYRYEHRIAVGPLKKGEIPHHLDYNKLNNDPSNFEIFESQSEHCKFHHEHSEKYGFAISARRPKTEEHVRKVVEARRANGKPWHSEETKKNMRIARKKGLESGEIVPSRQGKHLAKKSKEKMSATKCKKNDLLRQQKVDYFVCSTCGKVFENTNECFVKFHTMRCKGYYNTKEKAQLIECLLNHKVVKVEWLKEREDTYDISIEGTPNFPLTAGIFVHNCIEDIFIPVWGDVGDLTYDKIGGEADIRWIKDIEDLRQQLAAALRTPLPLLGAWLKEATGPLGSQAIEKADINFARMARKLQRTVRNGVKRICQIHLAYMNMDPDPNLFDVQMPEMSTAEEESLKESLRDGTEVIGSIMDIVDKVVEGEDRQLDKIEIFNYCNEKFLKLEDFDLKDFVVSSGALPECTRRKERMIKELGIKKLLEKAMKGKEKDLLYPKPVLFDTDLVSYVPTSTRKSDGKLDEKVVAKLSLGGGWLGVQRSKAAWEDRFGSTMVIEGELDADVEIGGQLILPFEKDK